MRTEKWNGRSSLQPDLAFIARTAVPIFTAVLLSACDSVTAPVADFDGSYPYVVSPAGVRVFGTSRLLVIPARFSDGAPTVLDAASINAQLFGSANGGPVNASFQLASAGGFTLRGRVTEWVTTSVSTAAARLAPGVRTPSGIEDYALEAIELADNQVDFGLFDNDGPDGFPNSGDDDGIVDGGIAIFNSDRNRYCDAGTGEGVHPFARSNWRLNGQFVPTLDESANGDVIRISGFTALSATGCGGSNVSAHVLAHELGHLFFRLPDLYHALGGAGEVWQQRRWVLGCWELMAASAWGCGTGAPTLDYRFNTFGAWSRMTIGWITPTLADVSRDSTYDLHAPSRGGNVLRVPISETEYLLLEYREAQFADPVLPANGVMIYHIAESLPRVPSASGGSYRTSLIEADDDSALFKTELQGGNRGTAGDAFGITRTSFVTGEHSRATTVAGAPLPFRISEIVLQPSQHMARVKIGPP